ASPQSWSVTARMTVGLTNRIMISISLPRSTLPHVFVRLRGMGLTDLGYPGRRCHARAGLMKTTAGQEEG
ncbi:MAG TPA: hypothetical protein VL614_05570, partial [Acetobacteraceae bacterium]|nr:hypothetical protein [Acetobacteraceae bacterium]